MKNIKGIFFCLPLLLVLLVACENDTDDAASKQYKINFVAAKTNTELEKLRMDPNTNLIRTAADLRRIVRDYNTPLSLLDQSELEKFQASVVFRKDIGVVGLNYTVLQENLTSDQVSNVLLLFGLDVVDGFWGVSSASRSALDVPSEDYKGYECTAKGTCFTNEKAICLSGC